MTREFQLQFDRIQLNHSSGLRIITYGLVIYDDFPILPTLLTPTVSLVKFPPYFTETESAHAIYSQ